MLTKITDDQKTDHDVDEKKVKHTKIYFIVICMISTIYP